MMRVLFGQIPEIPKGEPLPPGSYVVRLVDVGEKMTKVGDEMWLLKFAVEDERHLGRFIWDNLVFSDAGLPRVKLACEALGLDVSGEVELTPDMLIDRRCRLKVIVQEYQGEKRNKVAFGGYEAMGE